MKPVLLYFIEVNIYLLIFYLFYLILLRKETYSRLNRFYLLAGCFMSLIIPVINIPAFSIFNLSFLNSSGMVDLLDTGKLIPDDQFLTSIPALVVGQKSTIALKDILLVIACTISLFLILRSLINYLRILRIIKKHGVKYYNNYKIIYTENNSAIFSFLDYIFWNKSIDINKPEGQTIFYHETVHINEKHSIDLIFLEILTIFFFYNPVIYLYKRSIRLLHEYIADSNIISTNEITDNEYCSQLFNLSFNIKTNPLINNFFNNSNLKNRLKMITRKQKGKQSIGKLILILPLLIVILTISACVKINDVLATMKNPAEDDITAYNEEKEAAFFIVEDMPEFQGGTDSTSIQIFRNWIMKNLEYPPIAMENGIEGTVYATFVIGKNGEVESPKVLRGVDPALDAEAIKVLKSSPKWKPGKQRGIDVRVAMSLPIKFILDTGGKTSIKTPKEGDTNEETSNSDLMSNKEFRDMMDQELNNEPAFIIVEEMPEFQNEGENSLAKFRNYISTNLKYPAASMEKGIDGTVYVGFVVDETGSVNHVKVLRSVDPALDEEAKRVIMNSPKWTPGKQRGRNIKVIMALPIKFTLQ